MPDYSYKFRHRPEKIKARRQNTHKRSPYSKGEKKLRLWRSVRKERRNIRLSKRHSHSIKHKNVQVTRIAEPNNEPSVAVNPLDEKTVISAYNADFVPLGLSRSKDGGRKFANRILPVPKGFDLASDPIVDSGFPSGKSGKGLFLLGGLAIKRSGKNGTIFVQRSVNNGKTFSAPIIVNRGFGKKISNDKPFVAIDKSLASPFLGNAYISYTRFFDDGRGSVIFFQRSTDGGKTWSAPVRVSDVKVGFPFVQGSSIGVGLTGEVYIAWIDFENNNSKFLVRRSDDGGVTFGPEVTVAGIEPIIDPLPVPGWKFRVLTFANVRADTSGNFPNTVYAVWDNKQSGSSNILLSRSIDKGINWSDPIQVDDSPFGTQNFFSAVAVSPDTGAVNVIYYTNRVSKKRIDVFLARSTDGGRTFKRNLRVTDKSFDPNADPAFGTPSTFIGDYIGTAVQGKNGSISVWTDTRTGHQEIFSGRTKRR